MRARRTIFWGVLGACTSRFNSAFCAADNRRGSLGRAMPSSWHNYYYLVKSFMRHWTRLVCVGCPVLPVGVVVGGVPMAGVADSVVNAGIIHKPSSFGSSITSSPHDFF